MNKFNGILLFTVLLGSLLVSPKIALADSYGQGENQKSIVVDKKIRWIESVDFSDNIESDKKVFYNDDIIEFKISIKNNGKEEVNNIRVKDILPLNLSLIMYPGTVEKANGNIISWDIDKLSVGESKSFTIRAKIIGVKGGEKRTNEAEACTDQKVCDKDRASYFIGGKIMPVTGSGNIVFNSLIGISGIGLGLVIRKLARGY